MDPYQGTRHGAEIRHLRATQEPFYTHNPVPPPRAYVSAGEIEALPTIWLYGAPPVVRRARVVVLRIARERLEQVRREQSQLAAIPAGMASGQPSNRPMHGTAGGVENGDRVGERQQQQPIFSAQRPAFRAINNGINTTMPRPSNGDNKIQTQPFVATRPAYPFPTTTPNTQTTNHNNKRPAASSPASTNRTISHPPTPLTNDRQAPALTTNNTNPRPIPDDIMSAVRAVHSVRKRKDGLPMKMDLAEMEGFVSSHGRLKAGNPLRQWYGDLRLFDQRTWDWLMEKKD